MRYLDQDVFVATMTLIIVVLLTVLVHSIAQSEPPPVAQPFAQVGW